MNHIKNLARFVAVVLWLVIAGILYTAASHIGNAAHLGWFTLLIYAALAILVVYGAFFLTKTLWRIK